MYRASQPLAIVLPLLFLGLLIPASISLHRTLTLSLPIPLSLPIASIISPILTFVLLRSTQFLVEPPQDTRSRHLEGVSWPAALILVALTIYDVVLLTLSLSLIVPGETQSCSLQSRWHSLRHAQNGDAIKRIQDRWACCGFRKNTRDDAWPFPKHGESFSRCEAVFGRSWTCFHGWRSDLMVAGGLVAFVAAALLLIKIIVVVVYRVQNTEPASGYKGVAFKDPETGRSKHKGREQRRRLIEAQLDEEQRYRDDPSSRNPQAIEDAAPQPERDVNGNGKSMAGPTVQPSTLHGNNENNGNEWRA